ncbi:MAG: signal peptidase I [Chthoniobacteraceae bacterium]
MFFLTPRYIKIGRQFVKDAKKLLAYKRDLVTPEVIAEVETEIAALATAVKKRDRAGVEKQAGVLDNVCGKLTQPHADAWWRENVEVFLVAIVVALGVRTYFLQPFTIPTSSMFPTLNGIIFHKRTDPPPNILVRIPQIAIFGREYVDIIAREGERVAAVEQAKSPLPFIPRVPGIKGGIFDRTKVTLESPDGSQRAFYIKQAPETVRSQLPEVYGNHSRRYAAGQSIARGYFNAGDHVFVDKMSYHFRRPRRGETFVFSTADIPLIRSNTPGNTSQYYIKRVGGVPGDTLQIRPPELFIDGKRADDPAIARVMSGTREQPHDDYRGYGNGPFGWSHLLTPEDTFTLPPREYFALGDNSYSSWDSRGWGTVPERALMGRALIIYWPFWPHFGLAK